MEEDLKAAKVPEELWPIWKNYTNYRQSKQAA